MLLKSTSEVLHFCQNASFKKIIICKWINYHFLGLGKSPLPSYWKLWRVLRTWQRLILGQQCSFFMKLFLLQLNNSPLGITIMVLDSKIVMDFQCKGSMYQCFYPMFLNFLSKIHTFVDWAIEMENVVILGDGYVHLCWKTSNSHDLVHCSYKKIYYYNIITQMSPEQ